MPPSAPAARDPGPGRRARDDDIDGRRRGVGSFAGICHRALVKESNDTDGDEADDEHRRRDDERPSSSAGRYPGRSRSRPDRSRYARCRRESRSGSGASARELGGGRVAPDQAVALALPIKFESVAAVGRRRSSRYIVGTKIKVANVANSRPPITARPRGHSARRPRRCPRPWAPCRGSWRSPSSAPAAGACSRRSPRPAADHRPASMR